MRILFGALAAIGTMYLMNEAGGDGGDGGSAPAATPPANQPTAQPDKPPVQPKGTEQQPEPAKDDTAILDAAGFAAVEDDPGLSYTLKFLATNGFNAESPAVQAAFNGDFSLLKAEMSAKGIAGWEQALALGEQSYQRAVEAKGATDEQVGGIVTEIAEQFGVDWEAAVAHVSTAAKPEEKTALNGLLADPATAHIAAHYIASAFINNGDTEIEPQARATTDAPRAVQAQGGAPLSRREYTAEMGKLRQSLGDDYMHSPQAQALYKRLQK
jgi:hypothetical protein